MHSLLLLVTRFLALLLLLLVAASAQETEEIVTSTIAPTNTAIVTVTSTASRPGTPTPTFTPSSTVFGPAVTNLVPSNTAPPAAAASQSLPTTVIVVASVGGAGVLAAVCMGLYFCCCKSRRKEVKEKKGRPLDEGFFVPAPAMGEWRVEEGRGDGGRWSGGQGVARDGEEEEALRRAMPFAPSSAPFDGGRPQMQQMEYTPSGLREYAPPHQPPVFGGGYRGVQPPVRGYRT